MSYRLTIVTEKNFRPGEPIVMKPVNTDDLIYFDPIKEMKFRTSYAPLIHETDLDRSKAWLASPIATYEDEQRLDDQAEQMIVGALNSAGQYQQTHRRTVSNVTYTTVETEMNTIPYKSTAIRFLPLEFFVNDEDLATLETFTILNKNIPAFPTYYDDHAENYAGANRIHFDQVRDFQKSFELLNKEAHAVELHAVVDRWTLDDLSMILTTFRPLDDPKAYRAGYIACYFEKW